MVLENQVIAYLSFGHQFVFESQEAGRRMIQEHCAGYGLDPAMLDDLISELHRVEEADILSGVHIMEAVASYL